jgi:hypothetical protein
MKTIRTILLRALAALLAVSMVSVSVAQQQFPPDTQQGQARFSQAELDQMLAPIALYPDSLLSQVLMAATYPLEVVQAARWSRAHPGLQGEQAVRAVEDQDWDPSVKSLVAFPQILTMMDERIEWTDRLGDAFLGQQTQVMDSVQFLREKARVAGNLRSNEQMTVTQQGPAIVIEPPAPQVVYVPYYDPTVVYGGWWWPAYPPVYWPRPVAYYPRPAYVSGFWWGTGVGIGAGFFFGAFNWPARHATNVVTVNNYYYTRNMTVNRPGGYGRPVAPAPGAAPAIANWQHDPGHRRGVPYRDPAVREAAVREAGARGIDPRTVRGDTRPYHQADGGNRVDAHPVPQDRREANARQNAPAPGNRPDWRDVHRDNTRPDARVADPRVPNPAPSANPAPAVRDPRADGRGAFATPPATDARRMNGYDSRIDHRADGNDSGRHEARMSVNPGTAAPSPVASPAPSARAPEVRAQPRTENRGDGRADNSGGFGRQEPRNYEARGDGGRGRDQRTDTRGYSGQPVAAQQPMHASSPQMAEPRAHVAPPQLPQQPIRAPEVRAQAPSAPAMSAPRPAAPPSPQAGGGGNPRSGGNGGGGMMNGGGPQMR